MGKRIVVAKKGIDSVAHQDEVYKRRCPSCRKDHGCFVRERYWTTIGLICKCHRAAIYECLCGTVYEVDLDLESGRPIKEDDLLFNDELSR